MSDHALHDRPHHHHHADGVHPPAYVHPSILRLSAWQRMAIAAGLVVVIWAAVLWAIR